MKYRHSESQKRPGQQSSESTDYANGSRFGRFRAVQRHPAEARLSSKRGSGAERNPTAMNIIPVDYAMTAPAPAQHHLPALDPLVSSLGAHAWELLHHCKCVLYSRNDGTTWRLMLNSDRYHFRPSSIAIYPKKDWFNFGITHPALTQATLTLVSMDRDLNSQTSASATTIYHRTAAIRHIRELIESGGSPNLIIAAGAVGPVMSADVRIPISRCN